MRKQDYLIHLIRSLSPSEKRYFKLFCQGQAGGKKYLRLFNALEKADAYNAAALAKTLALKQGNLAHEKDYLQEVLLRNLRMYHENNFIESKMVADFLEADLLYRKGLVTYSIDRAEKTAAKACKYERFGLALNITRLLSHCYSNTGQYAHMHKMNSLEKDLLKAMTEYMEMVHLRDRFTEPVMLRKGFEALRDVGNHPLFKKKPALLKSWHARHCQSEVALFYYQYVRPDAQKTLQHAQNQLKLFQSHPHFKPIVPTSYYGVFAKICIRQYGLGNYREALAAANKLIEETQKPMADVAPAVTERYNSFSKSIKMTLLSLLHQFAEARTFGQLNYKITEGQKPGERITFLLDYALALFHTGDYDGCHTQLTLLMNTKTAERVDIQLYGRLLFIMLQLQLKNYTLIPYQVKSVRAWKKRTTTGAPGSVELLAWFDKLGKAGLQHQWAETFSQFKRELNMPVLKELDKELAINKWKGPEAVRKNAV